MLRNALIFLSESTAAKALVTKTPLRRMSARFVPGERVDDFLRAAREANAIEMTVTGNSLGEAEHDARTAKDAVAAYLQILDGIVAQDLKGNVSVKPTQVGLEIGKDFFKENLRQLMDRAKEHDIFIRWDMESSEWTQTTFDPFEEPVRGDRRRLDLDDFVEQLLRAGQTHLGIEEVEPGLPLPGQVRGAGQGAGDRLESVG